MSGHSKWANIKHRKEGQDAKRQVIFTKQAREIIVAAKMGGPDPDANFRLRLAIQRAKDNKVPADNIERAIRKGSGEAGNGMTVQEVTYEGYTAGGAAVMVQAVSDNRNRTASEIRRVFTRNGGALGESGSVAWVFTQKGLITAEADGDVDAVTLQAIDAGADDVQADGDTLEIYTTTDKLEKLRLALIGAKVNVTSSDIAMVPNTHMILDEHSGPQALRLLDGLEELDDVQRVFSNADIPDSVMASMAG